MNVPAFPTSTRAGPRRGAGVICHASSLPVIEIPSADNPADINSESREISGLRIVEGDVAREAKISARFVTDFEPGILTCACTGVRPRKGAGQCASLIREVYLAQHVVRIRVCAADMRKL